MSQESTTEALDEDLVADFLDEFQEKVRLGRGLNAAKKKYERMLGASDELEEAFLRARKAQGVLDDGHKVGAYTRERRGQTWYSPRLDKDIYWPPLRESLAADLPGAIEDIDGTSTAVLNGLRPSPEKQHSKGLVLGHVQSGKTTNFLSVIAKAADAGFQLVIVLTGITDNLRKQTQERIDKQLLSSNSQNWVKLTDIDSDFSGDKNPNRLAKKSDRFIAVVKKNSHRLRRLNQWLDAAGDHADACPILVIDDESDQASIDVSPQAKSERSAINRQINNLLDHEITAYVAYSATPFANILIDPKKIDDLYPSDFIITLPEPKGYFGSRALFGREPLSGENVSETELDGYDMIRIIPNEEVEGIRPASSKDPDKPVVGGPELKAAIRWFLMATAARWVRGQADKHSSMLIHTSMLTDDHKDLEFQIAAEKDRLANELSRQEVPLDDWRNQWETETERVPADLFELNRITFDEIRPVLDEVMEAVELVVDNGYSTKRLSYSEGPTTVIAIGGNTLARGLTLEGLVSSYFVRRASAYDTLLQMGRWFGFRNGYQDLPRIWMPSELNSWFRDLSTVEAELREELDVYVQEQVSPMEIQAKIRLHPDMMVTSKAKMQNAVNAHMSFSGKKEQTIKFREKDPAWLANNIKAVCSFISAIQERGITEKIGAFGSPVFLDVPADDILDFLDDYKIHEETRMGRDGATLLKQYIRQESAARRIRKWNVSIMGQATDKVGTRELGMTQPSPLISRAKMSTSKLGEANIKALVTTVDRLNDVIRDSDDERQEFRAHVREEIKKTKGHQESVVRRIHDTQVGTAVGHLAIYPIYQHSKPRPSKQGSDTDPSEAGVNPFRVPLGAEDDVMGLGIFFPTSNAPESTVNYISAAEPEIEFREEYQQAGEEIRHLADEDEQSEETEADVEKR